MRFGTTFLWNDFFHFWGGKKEIHFARGVETTKSDVFPQIPKSHHTHRALAPPQGHQSTRIQKNSGSTHPGLSKTVPTAPLAPFPAELGAFKVWAFLTKIGVATTENDQK